MIIIISIDTEKAFDKNQIFPLDKSHGEARNGGSIHQHYMDTYNTLIANSTLNGEKLQVFPIRSGMKQDIPFLHFYLLQCLMSQPEQYVKKIKGQK